VEKEVKNKQKRSNDINLKNVFKDIFIYKCIYKYKLNKWYLENVQIVII
jgi:hypothetical protein